MLELVIRAVPVQRGSQGEHVSYVASLTFGDIARLLDDGRLYVPNEPDLPDLAQRKLNFKRIKSMARYILDTYQEGSTFFPPICINVQPPPIYRDGKVFLPYHSVVLRLTDGQHRCFAIRQALKDICLEQLVNLAILSQVEVGALFYAGLSLEMERQAFRDQNLLAQRPGTSISHLFDQRSPVNLIAKDLIKRVPQFHNNVEMIENGLGNHNAKLLTLSTLVTAIQHMFPNLKSKKELEPLIDWSATFWASAARNLPNEPWKIQSRDERSQQRQESLVGTAVMFQALGLIAKDLHLEGVPSENLFKWLSGLQKVDWRRDNPLWQQRGILQIGAQGEPIISNTRTTVDAAHKTLREFIGIAPESGVI